MSGGLLSDKVVIVTGAAGLLGREFTKTILDNGGTCVLADIDKRKGILAVSVSALKKQFGSGKVDFVRLDITSKESIRGMIAYVFKKFKRIDALVNSAYPQNKNYGRKFEEVSYEDFCENVNTHLGGYFLTSQQLARFFQKQGQGNVINIASIYGVIAPRFEIYKKSTFKNKKMALPVEYAAIKSAVIHITKYMAKYFKGCNIRFNCISPGGVFNGQPREFCKRYNYYGLSKGLLAANDLNGTLLYLLSDISRYVNGQNIIVDDGWTL